MLRLAPGQYLVPTSRWTLITRIVPARALCGGWGGKPWLQGVMCMANPRAALSSADAEEACVVPIRKRDCPRSHAKPQRPVD